MSAATQFCAHIARIKSALAADSPVNVEQTIKGLLAQYGLGEISETKNKASEILQNKDNQAIIYCAHCSRGTGKYRYYVDGEWVEIEHPKKLFGDLLFQAQICPDCQKHEREKQLTK